MEKNYNYIMGEVFGSEGGYVNDKNDPGGPTNHGITQATLARYRGRPVSIQEVKDLKKTEAWDIYRSMYWPQVKAGELPSGLDYAVFDFGVNSGPGQAIKTLQRTLGVPADGLFGPVTFSSIAKADLTKLIPKYCQARLTFMKGLKKWDYFKNGWTSRVTKVQAKSLGLIDKKVSTHTQPKVTLLSLIMKLLSLLGVK